MVFMVTDAAIFIDFDGHGSADNVTRSEVFCGRSVAFHESLSF